MVVGSLWLDNHYKSIKGKTHCLCNTHKDYPDIDSVNLNAKCLVLTLQTEMHKEPVHHVSDGICHFLKAPSQ